LELPSDAFLGFILGNEISWTDTVLEVGATSNSLGQIFIFLTPLVTIQSPPFFLKVEIIAGVWGEVLPPAEVWRRSLQGSSFDFDFDFDFDFTAPQGGSRGAAPGF